MINEEQIILYDTYGNLLEYLTQWDMNQKLTIKGAVDDIVPMVHFSNKDSMGALVVVPTVSGSDIVVNIPNYLMQYPYPIIVHLYYEYNDGSSRTEYTTVIPLVARVRPEDFLYEENIEYTTWIEQVGDFVDASRVYAANAAQSANDAHNFAMDAEMRVGEANVILDIMRRERLIAEPITQDEYDKRYEEGTIDHSVLYVIVEG